MDTDEKRNNEDAQIRNLEDRLCRLAMEWRSNLDNRKEIKEAYRETIVLLISLGWDDILDIDCELPTDDMPEEYTSRHPYTPTSKIGSYSWNDEQL